MSLLHRRLLKIEASIHRPKPRKVILLCEPSADSTPDEREMHRLELLDAEASADLVILVSALEAKRQKARPSWSKVKACGSMIEAQTLALSLQPSEQGNKSRLDDVLEGLSGNVIGVAS